MNPKLASEVEEADWKKRDRERDIVPTDGRSWCGWNRRMKKEWG